MTRIVGWVAILIALLLSAEYVMGGTVRLTMVTPDPYPSDLNQRTLNCFPTSPTNLTFGRPFAIGLPGSTLQSSVTLPDESTTSNNGQTVSLPSSVDSVGLFYCEGVNEGMATRVYSIIHSPSRRFEPAGGLVTKTINKGEDATLSFVNYNNMGTAPLWRRVNSEGVTALNSVGGQYTITVTSADTNNGDLYAVMQSGVTLSDNNFAMVRLIVRGCSAGKWGPPSCTGVCDFCYNGGICDDSTGECICPPGFSGANCLNACGASHFGWDCELTCGLGNIIQSCTGSQFGLPDPYGSSCISGYTGRYCDSLCPTRKFGAGCTEDCHCSSSATCDTFNGRCSFNQCAAGWSGVNCQVPDICPTGYYGIYCLSKCYCLGDTACDKYTGYCSGSGGICAEGFNCVRVSCPSGYFTTSCDRSCHCLDDAACDGINGDCTASLGRCAANFRSDTGTNNCLLGIVEFRAFFKPNAGQDVMYSCTGSSGNQLISSSITLLVIDIDNTQFQTTPSLVTSSTLSNGELTNIFTVSGLRNGDRVFCSLEGATSVLTAEFYDPPNLRQLPQVTADSTSATVTWQAWQPGDLAGDGPVILYRVYHTLSSNISWVNSGVVPVTNQSETAYSFTVEPLQPETDYNFSVSAVRDGIGGEGRMITSDVIQTLSAPITKAATTPESTELPTADSTPQSESNTAVVAVVCVVVVLVIALVVAFLVFYARRRKTGEQTKSSSRPDATDDGNYMTPKTITTTSFDNVLVTVADVTSAYGPVTSEVQESSPPIYEDVGVPAWAKQWTIPWECMILGDKVLGIGSFGEVRDGVVKKKGEFTKAAIKTLKVHGSPTDAQNFIKELKTMTTVGHHPNIVSVLGACEHNDVLYVAMEYLPTGDLRSYLRRTPSAGDEVSLTPELMLQMAVDVAKGMNHLATAGVIHRDLAARNILLSDELVAKVSDFGLSRGECIYVQTSETRVPTRWLSLESLTSKTYTSKSDVWSFGILLWEIATFGSTPYPNIESRNLGSMLKTGYRMPKPTSCNNEIYNLMMQCWDEDPEERPFFVTLVFILKRMANRRSDEQIYFQRKPDHYVNIKLEFDDN